MTVAATVVVQFGQGVDEQESLVVLELDDAMNLDSAGEGKASFAPGETPYFLVHHDDTVRIARIACSSGSVAGGTVVSRTRIQQLQFVDDFTSQDLPHIPTGAVTWTWYGNEPVITGSGRSVKAGGGNIPAIGEASYSILAKQYKLTPPDLILDDNETYPVLIVVYMEAAI